MFTEAARWLPSMRVIRFHGPSNERERLKHSLRNNHNFDIMITTYETYVSDDQWFKSNRWTYCVLDEGHKIKNSETLLSHKVQGLGSLHRLREAHSARCHIRPNVFVVLTGTPVQNNLGELWGLLHWLLPTVFTPATQSLFNDSFDMTKGTYAIPFLNAAKKLLSTIMLRRTKANVVGDDVPPREELTVFIPLTETQRFWTYRLLTKLAAPDLHKIFADGGEPIKMENGPVKVETEVVDLGRKELLSASHRENQIEGAKIEGAKYKQMMNLLIQLRQVCDHPYLLRDAEPEPCDIAEHIVSGSSKLIAIDKLLADLLPKGERVLIFSVTILHCLFQQEKSPYQVFLVSTKAGGLGINLTKASTVIMCDSDWNPQNDLQAIARAHRIGQTKVVKVYRLICQGSVEDQMLDRIRRKLFLSFKIMGSDNPTASDNTSLGSSELMAILRRGSSALSHSDNGMNLARFLQASTSDILEHSRSLERKRDAKINSDLKTEQEAEDQDNLVLDAEEEERKLLSGVAQVQSRLFEGRVVKKYQSNAEIAAEWRNLGKRARDDRTVKIDGMTFITSPIVETVCGPLLLSVCESSWELQIAPPAKPVKKERKKLESEDWCIHCRDGGELTLCPRCPRDCLPEGDLDAIGETLPEFLLLNHGPSTTAYYIKCHDCIADFAENPDSLFWLDWTRDISQAEKTMEQLYAEVV
ncbi:hypothetical protein C0991_006731 [Blastosporella zonata]|nr:hypothetical protein C0991_006731 [Blastosporella zonata]